jgi:uncharacterized protein YfkK (UPF0435 family)
VSTTDLINVGLSDRANEKLDDLKERGIFADKIDGYRFGVSLALAHGAIGEDLVDRKNLFNVGSLDPDQLIKTAVEALHAEKLEKTTVYRLVERLADWGVNELHAQAVSGVIDFDAILTQTTAS